MGSAQDRAEATTVEARFERVLAQVERQMVPHQFHTWFRHVRLGSWTDGHLRILLPNRFFQEWFQSRFHEILHRAAEREAGPPVRVVFELGEGGNPSAASMLAERSEALRENEPMPTPPAATALNGTASNGATSNGTRGATPPTMPPEAREPERGTFNGYGSQGTVARRPGRGNFFPGETPLNPNYVFDGFVTGPSNELAYASSRAVADSSGGPYNPLFIHGPVGLGKTHLLHAIGNEFQRRRPDVNMCLLSCEEFTNAYIHALGHNQVESFRDHLRSVSLLVIDDIHFLANKERTQEEFFNTFNSLHQRRCQIVLSSDAAPADIPSLKERLVSRFEWGLVTCLEQPETETRMAIVRRKADALGLDVPNDVVEYIATHFRNNIRELEGAIQNVRARAEVERRPLDLALAERALAGLVRVPQRRLDLDQIAAVVAPHFQVEATDLKGRRRTRNISGPRQICMFLARELTNLSLQEIGQWFGGRDHTTVLFGIQQTEERLKEDVRLAQTLQRFRDRLGTA